MIDPSHYKSISEQSGIQSLLLLDDKGFVVYNSKGPKQQPNTHNYFELYQLSKYFYPEAEDLNSSPIVGVQTGTHITMIKAERNSDGQEKIVVMKQKITENSGEGIENA